MKPDSPLQKAQPRDLEKQAIGATVALYESWQAEGFQFKGEAFRSFMKVLSCQTVMMAWLEMDMPILADVMEHALANSGLRWPYPPTKYRERAFPDRKSVV